jgi:hypothetical protein
MGLSRVSLKTLFASDGEPTKIDVLEVEGNTSIALLGQVVNQSPKGNRVHLNTNRLSFSFFCPAASAFPYDVALAGRPQLLQATTSAPVHLGFIVV